MYGGRYSRIRYSLGRIDTESIVRFLLVETFDCAFSLGEDTIFAAAVIQTLSGSVVVIPSVSVELLGSEGVPAEIHFVSDFPFLAAASESTESVAYLAEDSFYSHPFQDAVKVQSSLGENTISTAAFGGTMLFRGSLGKNLVTTHYLSELLHCLVDVFTLENQVMNLSVTIPPGGRLVIDSENYNIYLNGKNVLHLMNGDWITLDRDTTTLSIGNGSGARLTGQLLYVERYL